MVHQLPEMLLPTRPLGSRCSPSSSTSLRASRLRCWPLVWPSLQRRSSIWTTSVWPPSVARGGEIAAVRRRQQGLAASMWPAAAGIARRYGFTETSARAPCSAPSRGRTRTRSCWRWARPNPAACSAPCSAGAARLADCGEPPGGRAHASGGVRHAVAALATLLLLGPVIALMPQAALAAVVVLLASSASAVHICSQRRVRRTEPAWKLASAFAGVAFLRHPEGDPLLRAASCLAPLAGPAGLQPAGLNCARTVARHHRVPAAQPRSTPPSETWPARLEFPAHRGSAFLRQR